MKNSALKVETITLAVLLVATQAWAYVTTPEQNKKDIQNSQPGGDRGNRGTMPNTTGPAIEKTWTHDMETSGTRESTTSTSGLIPGQKKSTKDTKPGDVK